MPAAMDAPARQAEQVVPLRQEQPMAVARALRTDHQHYRKESITLQARRSAGPANTLTR